MSEALGEAGVSVELDGAFAVDGGGLAHILVADADAARAALTAAGIHVLADRVQRLDESQLGQFRRTARRMPTPASTSRCSTATTRTNSSSWSTTTSAAVGSQRHGRGSGANGSARACRVK